MGLRFSPDAFEDVPENDRERLFNKVEWLWANRQLIAHWPLSENLSGYLKRRIGKYRIIYTYDTDRDDMVICLVGPRDTIYRQRLP